MSDERGRDFLRAVVDDDVASGRVRQVVTRFPPEPNGYLHIGHAKAICTDFGIAQEYGGICRLRFDDTNPVKEDQEYVDSIQADIRWLGFDWEGEVRYASDYFEQLHAWATDFVRRGIAYVDFSPEETIRALRGSVKEPGTPSPDRDRSPAENLALWQRMTAGEFPDGACVLRAKIDLASPNMKMRDPLMYRIRHTAHHHVGDRWCVYPFYDWAHGQSDLIEGVTHSICTLEFDNNRELYDWFLAQIVGDAPRPRQFEMARLALTFNVMSKRKLKQLVDDRHVDGWDDPRMLTLAGLRRRGTTPEALRAFVARVGVAKTNSTVDFAWLEESVRDDLNRRAPRRLGVLDPLRVELTNWPGGTELLALLSWPDDLGDASPTAPGAATRDVPFDGALFIDASDFAADPPPGWKRLSPGAEVRLRGAYVIRCDEVVHRDGVPVLRCTYDPATRGGQAGRKVAGTLHWVSAAAGVPATMRLYDRLFAAEDPEAGGDFLTALNPDSLRVARGVVEPSVATLPPGAIVQLERIGYFCVDASPGLVLNRTVGLRDGWGKVDYAPQDPRDVRDPLAEEAAAFAARWGIDPAASKELLRSAPLREAFEGAAPHCDPRLLIDVVVRDLKKAAPEGAALPAADLAAVARAVGAGQLPSARAALTALFGGATLAEVLQADAVDPALEALVRSVIEAWPDEAARFRAGERKLQGFFVGQIKRADPRADAQAAARVVARLLA